ncbi:MAG: ATP-binding protein [Opitutaceae bacterium]|nr:ATP-binding protein [Opitutaceae bacterium]
MSQTRQNSPAEKQLAQTDRYLAQAIFYSGLPAFVLAMSLLWATSWDTKTKITISLPVVIFWIGFALAAINRLKRSLLTLSNILASLREGDYSLRARARGRDDAMSDLTREVNRLGDTLRQQRRNETEATQLLTTVMQEIEVGVFAFDSEQRLRLANPAALRLLDVTADRVLGRSAGDLGLGECMAGPDACVLARSFPGAEGRWGMRRTLFHSEGKPHFLILIADLSRTLREEELAAWQRLVRVLGHEINNSLTPIKSIAGSLRTQAARGTLPADNEDLRAGLEIIETRAQGLSRFIDAYARLARLPTPNKVPTRVTALFSRIRSLDTRVGVEIVPSDPAIELFADPALLEQALINLVKNAVDAALAAHEGQSELAAVSLRLELGPGSYRIIVEDNGLGPPESVNLFVPFFTTKPGGSGIGLVFSRQIAESHGGTLVLESRTAARGCKATLSLPA